MLIGAALVKSERDKILAAIPRTAFSKETEKVMEAIRSQQAQTVIQFLGDRGCVFEKGKEMIQVMIDRIVEENEKQRIKSIVGKLEFAVKCETVQEFKERVTSILREI